MSRHPGWILLSLALAAPALAAPPDPLSSSVYDFPGAFSSPGSAASAGVAMADAWLADDPFQNPAMRPARGLRASPMLTHMSRQDLRGLNRNFSEQSAFFDAAGGWLATRAGDWGFALYAHQPVLRLEENAYLAGPLAGAPAPVENSASAREIRAGLAVSKSVGPLRIGVAGEWIRRDDSYLTRDKSGSPLSGTSQVGFSGSAVGGQFGARYETGPDSAAGHFDFGLAVRFSPELEVTGDQVANLVVGGSSGAVSATRESGIESGASVRWTATDQLRVLAGVGIRTTQEWQGWGVTRGGGGRWALAVDFHDRRDPWTVRFGLGQETQRGVKEPRAGTIGLGIGWQIDALTLDFGVVHHTFNHLGGANSSDDRLVATVALPF